MLIVTWGFLFIAFIISLFLPVNFGDSQKTTHYGKIGSAHYIRLTNDRQQNEIMNAMHEREIELETLQENHTHTERMYVLATERTQIEQEHTEEVERIKTGFWLSLYRTSAGTLLMLVSACLVFRYADRRDERKDNRLWREHDAKEGNIL